MFMLILKLPLLPILENNQKVYSLRSLRKQDMKKREEKQYNNNKKDRRRFSYNKEKEE